MEGVIARWYAKIRRSGSQIEDWRKQAAQLTGGLPEGADVLEVAPGPGYFAIEMARLGRFHVTGLDISHTFVGIARENARQAGVSVDLSRPAARLSTVWLMPGLRPMSVSSAKRPGGRSTSPTSEAKAWKEAICAMRK